MSKMMMETYPLNVNRTKKLNSYFGVYTNLSILGSTHKRLHFSVSCLTNKWGRSGYGYRQLPHKL